ncbi:glycosyltransferase family 8 protein [bacterium]|nr:MAG: glycosyltransferase family 8 protein [bacterium]
MERSSLNVFYVLDKRFAIHFTVSLTSLLENNKDIAIKAHVIHKLDDNDLIDQLQTFFTSNYSVEINFYRFNYQIPSELPTSQYITEASYYRLYLTEILPTNICFGLYIDCDTVVTGSLKELVDPDIFTAKSNFEYSILGVADRFEANEMLRLKSLEITTSAYFNAGVLMINLNKWRSENVYEKLIDVARRFSSDLKYHDQDVLNIYFRGGCGKLEQTFNCVTEKKLPQTPVVVHFSGASKPWHYVNNGPYKPIYRKYLKKTPFKKEKLDRISLLKFYRKYLNRLKVFLNIESFSEIFFLPIRKLTK